MLTVTHPVVHLNGTGRSGLIDKYRKACSAVRKAQLELRAARPHPRDYYVISNDAFAQAQDEFQMQERKLHEVEQYLTALLVKLLDEKR